MRNCMGNGVLCSDGSPMIVGWRWSASADEGVGIFSHEARFSCPRSTDSAARLRLDELSVAAADDRFTILGGPVREADTGRKVTRVGIAKALVYAKLAGGDDRRRGNRR